MSGSACPPEGTTDPSGDVTSTVVGLLGVVGENAEDVLAGLEAFCEYRRGGVGGVVGPEVDDVEALGRVPNQSSS